MIAILADHGVGGTFLNWSIYYLAGHSEYYSAAEQRLILVVDSPLTDKNAHIFLPNMPNTVAEFDGILYNLLSHQSSHNTIYFHMFSDQKKFPTGTADSIRKLLPHVSKTLLLTLDPKHLLYQCSFYRRGDSIRPSLMDPSINLTNNHEIHVDFINYCFVSSIKVWGESNLEHVWDSREFLALNFRPFTKSQTMVDCMDLSHDHYAINAIELWDRFDETVGDLFKYLELEINVDNFLKWKTVYNAWKIKHKNRVLFVWYFDMIIDYIINGYNLDLTKFNLDLYQEAAIQHTLIYKHNLNLKTWQLEKFTNTRQLHELLETNIHPLSNY